MAASMFFIALFPKFAYSCCTGSGRLYKHIAKSTANIMQNTVRLLYSFDMAAFVLVYILVVVFQLLCVFYICICTGLTDHNVAFISRKVC